MQNLTTDLCPSAGSADSCMQGHLKHSKLLERSTSAFKYSLEIQFESTM